MPSAFGVVRTWVGPFVFELHETLSTLSMPSTALSLGNAAVAVTYRSSTRVVIVSSGCEAILAIKVRGKWDSSRDTLDPS